VADVGEGSAAWHCLVLLVVVPFCVVGGVVDVDVVGVVFVWVVFV